MHSPIARPATPAGIEGVAGKRPRVDTVQHFARASKKAFGSTNFPGRAHPGQREPPTGILSSPGCGTVTQEKT